MKKLCARHGLVPPTGCPECKAQQVARNRARQKTDGRDRAWWRRFRQTVLERDGHRCVRCGAEGRLAVHFVPGGEHSRNVNDFESLCARCHGHEHAGWGQQRREDLEDLVA